MKRLYFIIIFLLAFCHVKSQKLNVEFRTVIEPDLRLHYLIFSGRGKCMLVFPGSHGMMGGRSQFDLNYKIVNDTIEIFRKGDLPTGTSRALNLLLHAKLVAKDGGLYDCISGYCYFRKKSINIKRLAFSLDGKIYKQNSPRARRKLKKMDPENVDIRVLKGQEAYLKYGKAGMNGVFEITRK